MKLINKIEPAAQAIRGEWDRQDLEPVFRIDRRKMAGALIAAGVLAAAPGFARADDGAAPAPAPAAAANGTQNAGGGSTPAAGSDGSSTKAVQVDPVVVNGKTSRIGAARKELDKVPGGTNVIDQATVERSSVQTNADVLALQAGVFAQSAGGTDGLKISIRGSDIQSGTNYFRTGILFMFDGLPVTGPGGTPYELFEPLGLQYTAVLRGANAFDVGALQLGGAINYVTKTGYDAAPFQFRVEGGSFGYNKEQVSSGGVIGNFDYYSSCTQ
jgi:iron complex outermembrane recepter protein